jgi:hypothetical protein
MSEFNFDTYGRFIDSVKTMKARAGVEEGDDDKEPTKAPKPGVLTRDMLTRLKRIVLGPSVTSLEQVADRFDSLLDAIDGDDELKKSPESGPTANARTR